MTDSPKKLGVHSPRLFMVLHNIHYKFVFDEPNFAKYSTIELILTTFKIFNLCKIKQWKTKMLEVKNYQNLDTMQICLLLHKLLFYLILSGIALGIFCCKGMIDWFVV